MTQPQPSFFEIDWNTGRFSHCGNVTVSGGISGVSVEMDNRHYITVDLVQRSLTINGELVGWKAEPWCGTGPRTYRPFKTRVAWLTPNNPALHISEHFEECNKPLPATIELEMDMLTAERLCVMCANITGYMSSYRKFTDAIIYTLQPKVHGREYNLDRAKGLFSGELDAREIVPRHRGLRPEVSVKVDDRGNYRLIRLTLDTTSAVVLMSALVLVSGPSRLMRVCRQLSRKLNENNILPVSAFTKSVDRGEPIWK